MSGDMEGDYSFLYVLSGIYGEVSHISVKFVTFCYLYFWGIVEWISFYKQKVLWTKNKFRDQFKVK